MENYINRVLFGYTAFTGPIYKFYATWNEEEGIVSYEINSLHPDYNKKATLDKEKSDLFLNTFYELEENRNSDEYVINEEERYLDSPSFQLVLSQGPADFEFDEWQYGIEPYNVKPLFEMIKICDEDANFLD